MLRRQYKILKNITYTAKPPKAASPPPFAFPTFLFTHKLLYGKKRYELNDWLGNVRVVINDLKTWNSSGYYTPNILSTTDYYAFGSEIKERSYTTNTTYRYGFNNVEKMNEIYGEGNHYDFKFRGYDARLGRFWSVDPLATTYPWNSTYAFAENDVIRAKDLEGMEKVVMSNINHENRTANIKIMKDIYIIKSVDMPQEYLDINKEQIINNFQKGNTEMYLEIKDNKPTIISENLYNKGIGFKVNVSYEIHVNIADNKTYIDKINDQGLNSIITVGSKSLFENDKSAGRGGTDEDDYRLVNINKKFKYFKQLPAENIITHEVGFHNMAGKFHKKDKYGKIIYPFTGLGSNIKDNVFPLKEETKDIINKSIERGNFIIKNDEK